MSDLPARATEIRPDCRQPDQRAGSGHPGSCLSAADVIAALYFGELRDGVDKFVLSKGHACPALYAALHLRGFYDRAALGFVPPPRRPAAGIADDPHSRDRCDVRVAGQGFSIAVVWLSEYRVSDTARIATPVTMRDARSEVF